MRKTTVAYFAGIVDGEGTIRIQKHRLSDGRNVTFRPTLSIANKNKAMMEEMHRIFGGYLRWSTSGNIYALTWSDRESVIRILKIILPYLIVKRDLAELVLEFERLREPELTNRSKGYSKEFHAAGELFTAKSKELVKLQYVR